MTSWSAPIGLAVAAIVAIGIAVDVLLPVDETPPVPERVVVPTEGAWHCAVGSISAGSELDYAVTTVTEETSRLQLEVYGDGDTLVTGSLGIAPQGVTTSRIEEERSGTVGAAAVWRGSPVLVSRTWRRQIRGEPPGTVHGPCAPAPSSTWYLPGMTTAGGASGRLTVANPFETDAAVSVTLLTPAGEETPELLRNIGVPSRSVRTIDLNEHAPERPDVGAVVSVRAGRVIVEGWQVFDPAIGGVAGSALAPLATEGAERWSVPWFAGGAAESWAWVANVGDRTAEIGVTVHDDEGGLPAEGVGDVIVPPGGVQRIPLDVGEASRGGLVVASENGVPIVVSVASRITSADEARTGFGVQLAQPEDDPVWAIPGLPGGGRTTRVHVLNPSIEATTVAVRFATQEGLVEPEELAAIEVDAGAVRTVDLGDHLPPEGYVTVLVDSDGTGVVAGLVSTAQSGPLHLVVHQPVPSRVWTAAPTVRIAHDPTLTRRIGTVGGPRVERIDTDLEDEVED